jgi:hypothetical protein
MALKFMAQKVYLMCLTICIAPTRNDDKINLNVFEREEATINCQKFSGIKMMMAYSINGKAVTLAGCPEDIGIAIPASLPV